jgi:PAS domain S-box-containing protein
MGDVRDHSPAEDRYTASDAPGPFSHPYELLFNMVADGIVIHEPISETVRGPLLQANPAFCRLLGYTLDEMRRLTLLDIMSPEDHRDISADTDRIHRDRFLLHRKTLIAKDGRGRPVEISTRLFEHQGRPMAISVFRDLTARERAGRALREVARRFRTTFENAAVGIAQVALDGRFIRMNRRFSEITGYPSEELTEMTFQDITHPEDLRKDLDQAELLRADKVPSYQMEKRYVRKNGEVVWVNLTVSLQRNEEGRPEYFIAVIEDISERMRAEEAVRRLAQFPEENPNPVLRVGLDGALLYANAPAVAWLDAMGGVNNKPLPAVVRALVADACRQSGPVQTEITDSDGQVFWFAAVVPVGEDHVNLYGRNITGRKQAEEALREGEERLKRSQEIAHLGSWELDLDEDKLTWSDEAYRIFGLEPQEFGATYEAFLDRVHPDDRAAVDAAYSGSIRDGRDTYEIEHRVLRRDTGEVRVVHEKCEHFRDPSGRIVRSVGMVHDITERKRAEKDLKEINETLEQRVAERTAEVQHLADRLRALASELSQVEQRERKRLSGILHDHIQQLLVAARMQMALVKRDPAAPGAPSAAQGVDSILREAIEASRSLTAELSPPILHEAGLAAALNWLAARMAEKNQFKVHVRADNSAEPAVEETRFLLFECVRELLFNALKHSGVAEAHVFVSRADGDTARIVVRDDGKGFDPRALRRRDAKDTTFGLFSIQQRLAHLGGSMEVEGAPGKGTRITLTAPIGDSRPRPKGRRRGPTETAVKGRRRPRKRDKISVLLVDDHKIVREGLTGLLELEPDIVVVGEAADGPHAVDLAAKLKPDVVIMDINLGEMNGIEATKAILAERPATKIIGLSMHVDRDVATAMRAAGARAYLSKGGPSEDLIDAIRATAQGK